MSDVRIPSDRPRRVAPVSQALPLQVPVDKTVELPEVLPTKERRKKQRRKGIAYRKPLIELRDRFDRRRQQRSIDDEA